MKPRKPIRRVSKKRAGDLRKYSMYAADYLKAHPNCEVCGDSSDCIHHKRGRGIHLNKTEFFLSVCHNCHNYIHRNPMWSKRMGYMLDRIGHE